MANDKKADIVRPRLSVQAKDALIDVVKNARAAFYRNTTLRDNLLWIDRNYNCVDATTVKSVQDRLSNMLGTTSVAPNFVVPMVKPQIETATGKLADTFLSGSQIFLVGADAGNEDAALQYNSIIRENESRGMWTLEFSRAIRDSFKYNLCGIWADWGVETTYSVDKGADSGSRSEVTWAGNTITRLDMYNTFWDIRHIPCNVSSKGEFIGTSQLLTMAEMKKYCNTMFTLVPPSTITAALNSTGSAGVTSDASWYYRPDTNPHTLESKGAPVDWSHFFSKVNGVNSGRSDIQYQSTYVRTTVYMRIIPQTFGMELSHANHPQIFKITIINGTVLFDCERMTNAHDLFPMLLAQSTDDGLGLSTMSMSEDLIPLQMQASSFWNAAMHAKRRAVVDRGIYNPLYIDARHINDSNPTAKIPMRAAAYDLDPSKAYYPIPFRDDQTPHFQSIASAMDGFSYKVAGTNPMQQGQFVKGNKTRKEVDDVSQGAGYRERLAEICLHCGLFVPVRRIMLNNTLQFQPKASIISTDRSSVLEVDPAKLRTAYLTFLVGDGFSPLDREMSTEEFAVALQTLQASPNLGADYAVGDIFSYLMKLRGADLSQFKYTPSQRIYNQQMQAWQNAAAVAAQKGAPFDVPMPTAPAQEVVDKERNNDKQLKSNSLAAMVAAGERK